MGLFSTKKRTYAYTSSMRMVEDGFIPNSTKHALMNSLLTGSDVNIAMREARMSALPVRLKNATRWANNNYFYGKTISNLMTTDNTVIKDAIKEQVALTGKSDVSIIYSKLGPVNNWHFVWKQLIDSHGYNPNTNQLGVLSSSLGVPVYLQSFQIKYCTHTVSNINDTSWLYSLGYPDTYGVTPQRPKNITRTATDWIEDPSSPYDWCEVTYIYQTGVDSSNLPVCSTGTFNLDFLDYEISGDVPAPEVGDTNDPLDANQGVYDIYYQALYSYVEGGVTKLGYFTYKKGSLTIPELDSLIITLENTGVFFPRVYFRLNGTNLASDAFKDTDAYKSSQRLGKRLNLNWKSLAKQIYENVTDMGDVEQIYLSCGLSLNTTDPLEQKYIHQYLEKIYRALPENWTRITYRQRRAPNSGAINLGKDIQLYDDYDIKKGQSIDVSDNVFTQSFSFSGLAYKITKGVVAPVGKALSGYESDPVGGYHWFKLQETVGVYTEYRIFNAQLHQVVVDGARSSVGGINEDLLIPLDASLSTEFSFKDMEYILGRSLYITFNTTKVVKTKWYQTGVFKVIMFIVAVALSVFTGGQSLTLYAILYAIAVTVLISIAINMVIKIAIRIGLTSEIIAVIAIVAAIAFGVYSTQGATLLTRANTVLQYTNVAFEATQKAQLFEAKQLMKEVSEFNTLKESQQELLDKAQELLKTNPQMDLLMGVGSFRSSLGLPNLGESPDDFYNRTIRINSVAPIVIEQIHSYADIQLTPPTPTDYLLRGNYV